MTFDCQSCGACCFPDKDDEYYVPMSDHEAGRFPAHLRVDVPAGARPEPMWFTKTVRNRRGTHCAALQGEPGKSCRCEAYSNRPGLCRVFENGSDACLDARETLFGARDQ